MEIGILIPSPRWDFGHVYFIPFFTHLCKDSPESGTVFNTVWWGCFLGKPYLHSLTPEGSRVNKFVSRVLNWTQNNRLLKCGVVLFTTSVVHLNKQKQKCKMD